MPLLGSSHCYPLSSPATSQDHRCLQGHTWSVQADLGHRPGMQTWAFSLAPAPLLPTAPRLGQNSYLLTTGWWDEKNELKIFLCNKNECGSFINRQSLNIFKVILDKWFRMKIFSFLSCALENRERKMIVGGLTGKTASVKFFWRALLFSYNHSFPPNFLWESFHQPFLVANLKQIKSKTQCKVF